MKPLKLRTIKEELNRIETDAATIEFIINNARLYNVLCDQYKKGIIGRDIYLMVGIGQNIIKQLSNLNKEYNRKQKNKPPEMDDFDKLIKNLKPNEKHFK